jgi:hypothetical protein
MKLIILCCYLTVFTFVNYSQKALSSGNQLILENTQSNDIARYGNQNSKENKKNGTFQLIFSKQDIQFAITDEFLKWVEENRILDKDKTVQIEENVSIVIFSKEKIEASNFQPVSFIIYKDKQ